MNRSSITNTMTHGEHAKAHGFTFEPSTYMAYSTHATCLACGKAIKLAHRSRIQKHWLRHQEAR